MNNDTFKADVNALLSKQSTNVISTITSNPLVQKFAGLNPFVSLGLSLASYFTSKSPQKDEKFAEIGCIVNLGTASVSATQQLQTELTAVLTNIDRFEKANSKTFSTYVKIVNYQKSLQEYRDSQQNSVDDPLASGVDDAFKDDGSAVKPEALPNTRFEIEQVKSQLGQFDGLIQQVGDFLSDFDAILSAQAKAFQQAKTAQGSSCAPNASDKLTALQQSISGEAGLKAQFDRGNWSVSAPQRALILGVVAQQ